MVRGRQTMTEEPFANAAPKPDAPALLGDVREAMEETMRTQFAAAERTLAARVAERMAGADALISRLTEENARLAEENAKFARTLERLRELAAGG